MNRSQQPLKMAVLVSFDRVCISICFGDSSLRDPVLLFLFLFCIGVTSCKVSSPHRMVCESASAVLTDHHSPFSSHKSMLQTFDWI